MPAALCPDAQQVSRCHQALSPPLLSAWQPRSHGFTARASHVSRLHSNTPPPRYTETRFWWQRKERSVCWGKICGVLIGVFLLHWKQFQESYNFCATWKIISRSQRVAEAANRLFNGVYPNKGFNCSSRLQPQARFLLHHLCLISLREKKSFAKPLPKTSCATTSILLSIPSCS